jgi:hypothetical protein
VKPISILLPAVNWQLLHNTHTVMLSRLFPVESHHLYKGHEANETAPVSESRGKLSVSHAFLQSTYRKPKSENRILCAHFFAVTVIQSDSSTPPLGIQAEHWSLFTVSFQENTRKERAQKNLFCLSLPANGKRVHYHRSSLFQCSRQPHRECMENQSYLKVSFRSLPERSLSRCLP